MEIIIRSPTPEDAFDIRRIQAEGWVDNNLSPDTGVTQEFLKTHKGISLPPSEEKIVETKRMIEENQGNYFVATIENKVVGWIMGSAKEDDMFSFGIYVDRLFRNQKVGTKLMTMFMESNGGKNTSIDVSTSNTEGIKFYEKFGFRIARHDKHYLTEDRSVYLPTVIMQNYE